VQDLIGSGSRLNRSISSFHIAVDLIIDITLTQHTEKYYFQSTIDALSLHICNMLSCHDNNDARESSMQDVMHNTCMRIDMIQYIIIGLSEIKNINSQDVSVKLFPVYIWKIISRLLTMIIDTDVMDIYGPVCREYKLRYLQYMDNLKRLVNMSGS
jgi:hypothetical protein